MFSKNKSSEYVTYGLRDMYHELGTYDFKIVLDPKFFKNSHQSEVDIIDSDGKAMKFSVERWGRKMNFTFIIDCEVPDGVSIVKLTFKTSKGSTIHRRSTFWVVKP